MATAQRRLEAHTRRQSEAKALTESDKENILQQRDEFQEENEGLKKYLAITQAKQKKEISRLKEELTKAKESVKETNKDLCDTASKYQDERSTNAFIREDLTKTKVRVVALERQLEACHSEIDLLRQGQGETSGLERHYALLSRELGKCVHDLQSLSAVTKQLLDGQDPNVSALLGIKDYGVTRVDAASSGDETDGGGCQGQHQPLRERLAAVEEQCAKVKEIRSDIKSIRESVSDKYAETLGDNMTSCVNQ